MRSRTERLRVGWVSEDYLRAHLEEARTRPDARSPGRCRGFKFAGEIGSRISIRDDRPTEAVVIRAVTISTHGGSSRCGRDCPPGAGTARLRCQGDIAPALNRCRTRPATDQFGRSDFMPVPDSATPRCCCRVEQHAVLVTVPRNLCPGCQFGRAALQHTRATCYRHSRPGR